MKLKAPTGGCTVRMYCHGLGDCFLLAFDAGNGKQKYMLIDCGVILGTPNAEALMQKVVEDICQSTGNHIDLLAVTHEHWDHVSGFIQAKEKFEKLKIDQVWLAWTEDPQDPLASELRKRRGSALNALGLGLGAVSENHSEYASAIREVANFFGEIKEGGSSKTTEALDWVKGKCKESIVYIKPGGEPYRINNLPGVRFFSLGPPYDPKFINKGDSASEIYLDGEGLAGKSFNPFNDVYERHPGDLRIQDVEQRYKEDSWRNIDNNWLGTVGELALQLDSHTNNTSMALAIEITSNGKVLLFPGDAQVGNWLSWDSVCWSGDCSTVTASDLLSRTVLYKVGHHGSHNATLREKGLERMKHQELSAIIPVDKKMAEKKRWKMPYEPLLERLKEHAPDRVVQADDVANEGKLFFDISVPA